MDKIKLNYFLNLLMAVTFILTVVTIFSRSKLHNLFGWIFVAMVIIHFLLHWKWLASVTKSIFKK